MLHAILHEHAYKETFYETSRTLIHVMLNREQVPAGFTAQPPQNIQTLQRRVEMIDKQLCRNVESVLGEIIPTQS